MRAALCLLLSSAAPMALATETDNFTKRPANFSDPAPVALLDQRTEELLLESAQAAKGCELQSLHAQIRSKLSGGMLGNLEAWMILEPKMKRIHVPYDQSIYAGAGFNTKSMGLGVVGIAPSFVIQGYYMGADKVGHFVDQGYQYYEEVFIKHQSPMTTFRETGPRTEEGTYGMAGNGVRSFADMAANFSGYLFWRSLVGGNLPYFSCGTDRRWVRTARRFTWREYVNIGWDEAINCSEYSPAVQKVVSRGLKKLGVSCPLDVKRCQDIADLPCGTTYLSPACLPHVTLTSSMDPACAAIANYDDGDSQASRYSDPLALYPEIKSATETLGSVENAAKVKAYEKKEELKDRAFKAWDEWKRKLLYFSP